MTIREKWSDAWAAARLFYRWRRVIRFRRRTRRLP